MLGGALISGLFISFNMLPPSVQTIGYLTPQYWAQTATQSIMLRGADLSAVLMNIVVLLAFGLVGLIIALLRFKRFIRFATN